LDDITLTLHKQQDEGSQKENDIESLCDILAVSSISLNRTSTTSKKSRPVICPAGKPMILHLLRCQGIAVGDYSFNLGRLEAAASSTFASSGIILALQISGLPI